MALPSHEEAVARLIYAIDSVQPRIRLTAESGMGKTLVLRKALEQATEPRRRIVSVGGSPDGMLLLVRLAERLGQGSSARRVNDRAGAWRVLDRAVRLLAVQGFQAVIAIDDCHLLAEEGPGGTLETLCLLANGAGAAVTVIQVGRPHPAIPERSWEEWPPMTKLEGMTRAQSDVYLETKLRAVGSREPAFTTRAVTRIHGLARGIPREMERLAILSLMAGALRSVEVVSAELVDQVAGEMTPTLKQFVA